MADKGEPLSKGKGKGKGNSKGKGGRKAKGKSMETAEEEFGKLASVQPDLNVMSG